MFEDPKSYQYLSNGNLSVPGLNDLNEYEDTKEAMKIMGMSEDEQSGKGEGVQGRGRREREGEGREGGRREGGGGREMRGMGRI